MSQFVNAVRALGRWVAGVAPSVAEQPRDELQVDLETAVGSLRYFEAVARVGESDAYINVANNEAYMRLLGAILVAWIVGSLFGTPDLALEAVAASIAALVFVIVSGAMAAHWGEALVWRQAIEDLAQEIESVSHGPVEDRSAHYRRAIRIVEGRLERAIRAGERSTLRIRRLAWVVGQIPWLAAGAYGALSLVVAGAAFVSGVRGAERIGPLVVYGVVYVWAGYTIRQHFAPRRADLVGRDPRQEPPSKRFMKEMRRARENGLKVVLVEDVADRP